MGDPPGVGHLPSSLPGQVQIDVGSQVVAGWGVRGGTPDTETAQVVGGMCPLITRNGSPGATGAERLGGCWEASGVRGAVAGAAGVGGIGAACG